MNEHEFNSQTPPPVITEHPFFEFIGTYIIDAFQLEERIQALNALVKGQQGELGVEPAKLGSEKRSVTKATMARSSDVQFCTEEEADMMASTTANHVADLKIRDFLNSRLRIHAPGSKHVHFNPLDFKDIVKVMAWMVQPLTP